MAQAPLGILAPKEVGITCEHAFWAVISVMKFLVNTVVSAGKCGFLLSWLVRIYFSDLLLWQQARQLTLLNVYWAFNIN